MKSSEYYNDKVDAEYYNHLKPVPEEMEEKAKSVQYTALENEQYIAENETSL